MHTSSPTDSRALSLDRVRWRRSKVYGRMGADEKDIGYVSTLHNLAFSSQAAGDLRRAIPLYHDVVRLWKQTVGPKHIAYATSMLNLAVAHYELGEHKEALKRGQEALKLFESLDGDTAGALGVVGSLRVEEVRNTKGSVGNWPAAQAS